MTRRGCSRSCAGSTGAATFTSSAAPRTIETFRALGALDKLGLIVLPFLVGEGMGLTPSLSTDARLRLESERVLPGGYVEIVYACNS
jgi:hypothetical protein